MSLTSILGTATAALQTTQYQIAVTSDNVANADTAGATQKTYVNSSPATLTSSLTEGEVTRITNTYLSKTVNTLSATAGASSTIDSYLSSYDTDLGSTTDGNDISSLLTSFQNALEALSASTSSSADTTSVVDAASSLAEGLSSLSNSIQSLRTQANDDIGTTVDSINSDLKILQTLNSQVASAEASGTDATGYEDQRDTVLTDLSSMIGVQYYTDSNNQLVVYDQGGDQLLGSTAASLSYASTGQLSADTTYPASISGIALNGKDVTGNLTSGSLGALVQLRDTTLVQQQDQLDQLASTLIQTANAATSAGTASPPPNSLTGDTAVSSSDSLSASGDVRIAVTDSSGKVVSSTDLDLSSYSTVGDLVTALNGIGGISASISSSGGLTIQATSSSDGVAVNGLTSSVGSSGQSFSSYFGINTLFTGDDASTIAVSSTLSADPSDLPTATLSDSSSLSAGDLGVAASDYSAVTALSTALGASQSVAADGGASATTTSLSSLATRFVSGAASLISNASTSADDDQSTLSSAQTALSNATGVDADQQTALLTQYQNQYEAAAQILTAVKAMYSTLISMMEA